MTNLEMIITVAIAVLGTQFCRYIAFWVFPQGKPVPPFVLFLGKALPAAVIGMLVVYTFKDTAVLSYLHGVPELIAIIVTAGFHVWKRNMMVSIATGTIVYMMLMQTI